MRTSSVTSDIHDEMDNEYTVYEHNVQGMLRGWQRRKLLWQSHVSTVSLMYIYIVGRSKHQGERRPINSKIQHQGFYA